MSRPGGGPGALSGALGVTLGALGASFVAPGSFLGRLGGGRGANRAGSLKKATVGYRLLVPFFVVFHTLFGASPALIFEVVGGGFLNRFSSCSSSLFATRGKGRHAFDTVKTLGFQYFSKFVKAAALRKQGRQRRENAFEKKLPRRLHFFVVFSLLRCLSNGVAHNI